MNDLKELVNKYMEDMDTPTYSNEKRSLDANIIQALAMVQISEALEKLNTNVEKLVQNQKLEKYKDNTIKI